MFICSCNTYNFFSLHFVGLWSFIAFIWWNCQCFFLPSHIYQYVGHLPSSSFFSGPKAKWLLPTFSSLQLSFVKDFGRELADLLMLNRSEQTVSSYYSRVVNRNVLCECSMHAISYFMSVMNSNFILYEHKWAAISYSSNKYILT